MKVFLDDQRDTPEGWVRTYSVADTISLLRTRLVTHLSVDNDLGAGQIEGFKTLDWLEEEVHFDNSFPVPEITIHSSNSSRKVTMKLTADRLEVIRQQQTYGS